MTQMDFRQLQSAVAGNAAAIRHIVRLLPAGGQGSKVFPPTHSGGVYAWEKRRIAEDKIVPTVLLDSVQSQANRMEQALLEAHRAGRLKLPLLQIDFTDDFPDTGVITTLDAPHRIADAIFRESLIGEAKFRESDVGMKFIASTNRNATGLFEYCPHALIFGVWDSTGAGGGQGNKFQRAVVSEIVGIQAERGVRTSSRIDPLIRSNRPIYQTTNGDWTANPEEAKKDDENQPIRYGKKLSELNLGNVTPDLVRYTPKNRRSLRTMYEEIGVGEVLPGGVTLDYAIQTTVLSLPALRRLRFPINGADSPELNNAARTVLASLALAGICHMQEQGYDLRSRCLLIPQGNNPFELIANDGTVNTFELNARTADEIFAQAVTKAKQLGLPWHDEPITLVPGENLVEAARRGREAKAVEEESVEEE
jgi:CRISPR-associated protein Csb1